MKTTCLRALTLALLLVGVAAVAALALPGFSDQNIAAGNLNPTDTIKVQEIRITRGASEIVTLSSVTVQNLGTAGDGDIDKIIVMDGGDVLGETTAISGLATGITVNLSGFNMTSTTHYLKIFVTVGTAVDGGETVNLRVRVHYVSNGSSYTSAWITDLTGETIRKGGFDVVADSSPDAGYMNPGDKDVVQITVFSDIDANGKPVEWQGVDTTTIVQIENLGTAVKTNDIAQIRLTLTISGTEYIWDGDAGTAGLQDWGTWNPASPMSFAYNRFWNAGMTAHPPQIPDNGVLTVKVEMGMAAAGLVTDGRTIRTKTTVKVREQGQDSADPAVLYDQVSSSETTQTLRKQGLEEVHEESESLGSGIAATGNVIVQTVRGIDKDRNADAVRAYRIYIRNNGTADGTEINRIEVKAGATTLWVLDNSAAPNGQLPNFRTGAWYNFTLPVATPWFDVLDDHEQVFKIYYTIGTPTNGHTLKPAVRIGAKEPVAGTEYQSDEVVYPDTLALYLPGFEFVENMTPPEGGVAYSGQRLLAQTVRVEDRDEDTNNVTINPIVVKNVGNATSTDVTKVEVWRANTADGTKVKLGETTDLTGFRTGGARVEMTHDNILQDVSGGAIAYLFVYLTIAEPEAMTATRTIQLETRVLHTENLQSFDKMVVSNQWTLEVNHRPVPTFTFAKATPAAASIVPKADFAAADTIQFTGSATDPDADAIVSWSWNFGDGSTASVQNPTHRYPNGGTFNVRLTVTDARGVTGSVTKQIVVTGPPNQLPVIGEVTAVPANPAVDDEVTFAAVITDPDQPAATAFVYLWEFGDADDSTSTVAGPVFSYDTAGAYTVNLTVTDAQGGKDTATIDVSVGNENPVIGGLTANPTAPNTGDNVTLQATNVTDADDDLIDHYEWNFGDGTTNVNGTQQIVHIYGSPDTYTVSVVAVDDRGGRSAAKTLQITVEGPTRVVIRGFPNPASTTATIEYFLPTGATAPELLIFDLGGRRILRQALPAGDTEFDWDLRNESGTAVSNGLYLCMITATSAADRTIKSDVFRLLVAR